MASEETPTQRLLIRAGRPPHDETSNVAALAWRGGGHFASNTGNMLYSDSVYRALNTPRTEIVCDAYAPQSRLLSDEEVARVNERFDAYILPLANAFRPEFIKHLVKLTSFIERLAIPTIVTGVGSQSDIGIASEKMDEETRRETIRFVSAVLNKGGSIGVRGELTRKTLLDLGFHDSEITVIGCPSMYDGSREFAVHKSLDSLNIDSKIAINHEWASVDGEVAFYQANEERYRNLTSIYQTSSGGEYILWGRTMEELPIGIPRSVEDKAYRENRLRFFTNVRPWKEFLAQQDFSFGIRLHGVIAALTAGTPAVLMPIDSRTQELSEYHALPHKNFDDVMKSGKLLAEDLYELADFSELNRRMPENWDRYYKFLEDSGLHHIHESGMENPEYEELLRTFHPAPGIEPINFSNSSQVASRFQWLWQDRATDHWRTAGAFEPESDLDVSLNHSLNKSFKDLEKKNKDLTEQSRKLQNDLKSSRQSYEKLQKRVEELEDFRQELHKPFEKRVAAAFKRRVKKILPPYSE
jgi:hypothetical protein